MTGNHELMYWRKNKEWYDYDNEKKCYFLTDKADERVKKSFEMYKEFNRRLREGGPRT